MTTSSFSAPVASPGRACSWRRGAHSTARPTGSFLQKFREGLDFPCKALNEVADHAVGHAERAIDLGFQGNGGDGVFNEDRTAKFGPHVPAIDVIQRRLLREIRFDPEIVTLVIVKTDLRPIDLEVIGEDAVFFAGGFPAAYVQLFEDGFELGAGNVAINQVQGLAGSQPAPEGHAEKTCHLQHAVAYHDVSPRVAGPVLKAGTGPLTGLVPAWRPPWRQQALNVRCTSTREP